MLVSSQMVNYLNVTAKKSWGWAVCIFALQDFLLYFHMSQQQQCSANLMVEISSACFCLVENSINVLEGMANFLGIKELLNHSHKTYHCLHHHQK